MLALAGAWLFASSAWAQYRPYVLLCSPTGERDRITAELATLRDCVDTAHMMRGTYNWNRDAEHAFVLRVFVHQDPALEAALTADNLRLLAREAVTRLEVYHRANLGPLPLDERMQIQRQQARQGGPFATAVLTQAAPLGWTLVQAYDLRAAPYHAPAAPPHAQAAAAAAARAAGAASGRRRYDFNHRGGTAPSTRSTHDV
jgi:hypothetical protein